METRMKKETKKHRDERENRRWKDRMTCELMGVNMLGDILELPEPAFIREIPQTPWER